MAVLFHPLSFPQAIGWIQYKGLWVNPKLVIFVRLDFGYFRPTCNGYFRLTLTLVFEYLKKKKTEIKKNVIEPIKVEIKFDGNNKSQSVDIVGSPSANASITELGHPSQSDEETNRAQSRIF